MVDFTDAQAAGGTQGSPVTVSAPVSDRSSEMAVNVFSGAIDRAKTGLEASQRQKASDMKVELQGINDKALSDYTNSNLKLAMAVEQGAMSSSKARTLMRVNTSTFIADNPSLREAAFKAHKSVVSGSGLGKVIAEGTNAEKLQIKLEEKAALEGWLSPDMSDTERADGVQNYLDNKQASRVLDESKNKIGLATSQLNLTQAQRKAKVAEAEIASKRALGDTASAWSKRAVGEVESINRQVESGTLAPAEGEIRLKQLKATLSGELSRLGVAGGAEYLNTLSNPIMDIYDNGVEQVSGRIDAASVKLDNERKVAIATNKLLQNEEAVRIKAAQSLSNHSDIISIAKISPIVVDFIQDAQDVGDTTEVANLTTSRNVKDTDLYLGLLKDNYKAEEAGKASEETKQFVLNGVNDMLKSLPTHEGSIKSVKQIASLVNHFASNDFGTYSVANKGKMDEGSAAESVQVIQRQIMEVLTPELDKFYNSGFKISGNPKSRVNPLPPTEVSAAVMPTFANGSFKFIPRPEFIKDPDVQARASRLTKDLSPTINKLIKAESHLMGHKSYSTTYQNLLPAMFPQEELGEGQQAGKVDRETKGEAKGGLPGKT